MLDRSASMHAHDIPPSRFSRATLKSATSCGTSPKTSIASGSSASPTRSLVLSYLTRDVDTVLFYFDWIDADPTTALRHRTSAPR